MREKEKEMAERERASEREREREREKRRRKEGRKRSRIKKTWMHLSRVGKNVVTLSDQGILHSSLAHWLAYTKTVGEWYANIQCKRKG